MDFALTDEERDLSAAAARLLADRYPVERVAALADADGVDPDTWPHLRRQGWCDPDLGMVEKGLLAQEGGYALAATPWWSTVGLAHPIHRAAGRELTPDPLTVAWQDDPAGGGCHAVRQGGRWRLTGLRALVTDATSATALVVAAGTDAGLALFAVASPADGLTVEPQPTLDRLRGAARLRFADTPGELLVAPDSAGRILAQARRHAGTLLACEAVGVARRALELARRHAGDRVQFGRPIGAYQAVAHRLADSYVTLELATSLALRACWLAGADDTEPAEVAHAHAEAVVAGRQAAVRACEDALQVTGGLGATWEYPLHWWYRRALWLDSFDTPTGGHLATLADHLLAGRPEPARPTA
ncbi:acyl-CoA dehydrogenase [Micromonospora phaseoli]|uniref:Acyl-CoA dehydrogenase n=2 Tax=Micromonospora phaseoli TaxID=1144548 RepID=A0A1H6YLT6_9ACTN|nr:acyl-CoA dehydrogenase [Micromonospora phaseoli]PZW00104.1 acyl-CoA dehydrogenase [Micromonospora phaseoli]GIJ79614.1 acyl-CoA dehydrogenase [Micromonospora phaseoli]SEJ38212.1 acyl-CoA dehydrogenase [Micromonospora phaseoli]